MFKPLRAALFLTLFFSATSAFSFPMFLEAYRGDPFRRPTVDGCATCHMSPQGGDERNPFGQAFESGGEIITPLLRAQWPDRFVYPTSRTGDAIVHFSDPQNKQFVLEVGGTKVLVDLAARTVGGQPAGQAGAAAPPAATAATSAPPAAERPNTGTVDSYAHEGVLYGLQVVNIPTGKPQRRGGIDFMIAHRFFQPVYTRDANGDRQWSSLLGFDSSAIVAYGFRFGLTNHVSVGFLRSTLDKTMEFNSMLSIVRQGDGSPVTVAVRGGIEARNNFKKRLGQVQPSPFIEPVLTHTIKDRVSLVMSPIFAFNTRNETDPASLMLGGEHNHTISLGLGTGIRVLPTMSVVGEVIPRLWGYKGLNRDRAGFSLGLQKSTFRHTFEFVLSRQESMTTNQTAVQAGRFGVDTFRLGFNIYRKIR